MGNWWLKTDFDETLKKRPSGTLRVLIYALIGCVGYVDHTLGSELGFSTFYLIPIILATRNLGRNIGILVSFLCIAVWLYTESLRPHLYHYAFAPYCNAGIRLTLFIIVVMIFDGWEREKAVARLDALTLIANRKAFYEFGTLEVKRCRRYSRPFSVAYIDVDNFKTINDRFGHRAGDKLLMVIAQTLDDNFRETDMVARLGGDEFAVIFSETAAEAARKALARVGDKLSKIPKTHSAVTLSVGLATFSKPPDSFEEVVKKADELMYLAKNKGKNCVQSEVFEGPFSPL